MAEIIARLDSFLWGWPLIILLFGTHIFMTIRTGFIQKDIFKAIKLSVTRDPDAEGDVSQFGALTTALSSTIGTGFVEDFGCTAASDTIDVCQRNLSSLILRNIYTNYSYSHIRIYIFNLLLNYP